MKHYSSLYLMAAGMLALPSVTSCVDETYDLDNINTDIEVKVNDLVVPVNLDAITLSNVFDLDDESVVKEINGEYAVLVDGSFSSSPVTINAVSINPGTVNPVTATIFKYDGGDVNLPPVQVGEQAISYAVTQAVTPFSFSSTTIDKSIREVSEIKGNWNIDITLKLNDINSLFSSLTFQNLKLHIPAGFSTSTYPCTDGIVSLGDVNVNISGETHITLVIDHIDVSKFETGSYTFTPAGEGEDYGSISFNGTVGVESGYVVGKTNATSSNIPQSVTLVTTPKMGRINVSSISGRIGFKLNSFNVSSVTLNDLPELLYDDETKISIANPQLYISLNNPVANDKLEGKAGMTLTSYKNDRPVNTCSLDEGQEIVLGCDKGVDGPYNLCLSPTRPASYYTGYADATHVGYASLSDILSGSGLPDKIEVAFDNPRIVDGKVTDFTVDRTLLPVEGTYTFYAPLQFNEKSQVVYSERETGWSDETLDKITITTLSLTATVTNTLPFDIEVSGTPLDVHGNPCVDPGTGAIVRLEGLTVKAGTTAPVSLKSTGTLKGLDGIEYSAKGVVTDGGQVLKPSSPIEIKDIRVTVSGNYIDTL